MKIPIIYLAVGAAAQGVVITAPSTVPSSASGPVDKSFLGLMVETTSWWVYASVAMSLTLIKNLVNRTAAPVIIRVGGTSGDETTYDASQTDGNLWPYGNDGLLAPVSLGQPFTTGLNKVPACGTSSTSHSPTARLIRLSSSPRTSCSTSTSASLRPLRLAMSQTSTKAKRGTATSSATRHTLLRNM
jgi:hypothetical protein